MKKGYLLSPALDIIEFTTDLLLEDSEELSHTIVVFPGKRPGHFLRKYLAARLKHPFIPPKILSMDEFIDFIYTTLLCYVDRLAEPIDCVPIIFNLNKTEKLVENSGRQLALDEFLPWGFKLFADFEEMYIEEIPPERLKEVEEIAGGELPVKIGEGLIKLSRLYQLFYEELQRLNLSTRSLRYRRVGEQIKKANFNLYKLFFVGLFALTNSEKRILSQLARDGKTSFIFQDGPGIDQTIKALKIEVDKIDADGRLPIINFYQAMDTHSEVFKLNQLISQRNNFCHKDVIVLPLPDTLFPVVQHTIGFIGKDYNISIGYPLLRTPVYALIQTLSELIATKNGEEYYLSPYFNFVLHPYVKNIYFDRKSYATRIIFHTIEEKFMEKRRLFVTLRDIEEDREVFEECIKRLQRYKGLRVELAGIKGHLRTIHNILIRPFEEIKDIGDFADKFLSFFSFISEKSPANLHPFTAPFIKAALEAIYELKTSNLKMERFKETDTSGSLKIISAPSDTHFPGHQLRDSRFLAFWRQETSDLTPSISLM